MGFNIKSSKLEFRHCLSKEIRSAIKILKKELLICDPYQYLSLSKNSAVKIYYRLLTIKKWGIND
jgi:hypothetical protein